MVAPPMSLLVAHNMSRAIAEGTKVLCPLTNPRESTSKATNDPTCDLTTGSGQQQQADRVFDGIKCFAWFKLLFKL